MTLQQLRYITTVADTGTITEAAKKLYISQPSLTNAIHELEKEMGITIFNRTNKGIFISREGEEFLGYARQVLEQTTICLLYTSIISIYEVVEDALLFINNRLSFGNMPFQIL